MLQHTVVSFFRRIITLSACYFLGGCAGHMEISAKETHSTASVKELRTTAPSSARDLLCPIAESPGEGHACGISERLSWTVARLKRYWGEPSTTTEVGNDLCLIYHRKLAWRGNVWGFGIALPLVAPIAFDNAKVCFHGDVITDFILEDTGVTKDTLHWVKWGDLF